jgi:ATPase subunit of ABC transporter with duplicated ATPase domains
MVVGEETPDEGTVSVPKKLTIGYFRQDVEEMQGRSVLDEAIAGSGRLGDLHHELEALQREMSDPASRPPGSYPFHRSRGPFEGADLDRNPSPVFHNPLCDIQP